MRVTNLGFKSPREVCQAPQYNPTTTSDGKKLINANSSNNKKRPKSNLSSRFCDPQPYNSGNSSVFLGPGKYNDDHNTISHTVNSKITAKYKGDVLDSKGGPYTYVGDSKVLDLAFLSPKTKKLGYPYVMVASINLATPTVNTPAANEGVEENASMLNTTTTARSLGNHNRTKSFQTFESTKSSWEKHNTNGRYQQAATGAGLQPQKTSDEQHIRKGSMEVTKSQKQKNDMIYSQLVSSQLSNELKLLKKELEDFQKKKAMKDIQTFCAKDTMASTEVGTIDNRKEIETEKEDDKILLSVKENRYDLIKTKVPVQIHSHRHQEKSQRGYIGTEAQTKQKHQAATQREARVLVETSRNIPNSKKLDISFNGNELSSRALSSPKFGAYEGIKGKTNEGVNSNNTPSQKSLKKAMDYKRKAQVAANTNSSFHSSIYNSVQHDSSRHLNMTSKTVRKI